MNLKVNDKLSTLIPQPLQKRLRGDLSLPVGHPGEEQSSSSLSFEHLASSLLHSAQASPLKSVAVIGTTAGVGASTVAYNLAKTLAPAANTLLVAINAQENREMPGSEKPGNAEGDMISLSRRTGDNFYHLQISMTQLIYMTSGHNMSLQETMNNLEQKFDWIIWDLPPVDKDAHVREIARKVQGVMVVVHAGKTRWHSARHTLEHLRFVDANILGVVLNKKKAYIPTWIYRLLFRNDT